VRLRFAVVSAIQSQTPITAADLLNGLTLFELPIPEAVAEKVARMVGGSLPHLRDFGRIDVHEDLVDHRQPAAAVNALAAARVAPLTLSARLRRS
jgi:hypothetical protein